MGQHEEQAVVSILEEHPRWIEHEARVAEANERRSKVSAAMLEEGDQYRKALVAHKASVEEAVRTGVPIPQDEPVGPSRANEHALRYVQREQEALHEEGKRLQADLLPEMEAEARERWETRKGELAEVVQLLTEAAQDLRQDAGVVAQCRTLVDNQKKAIPRPTGGERTTTRWDVADVVDVLQHGRDPFALIPLDRGGPRIMDGHGAPSSTPPRLPTSRIRPAGFVSL